MYQVICFDRNQYGSYAAAKIDGATTTTSSTIDAVSTPTGIYDLIEVVEAVCSQIGGADVELGILCMDEWLCLDDIKAGLEGDDTVEAVILKLYTQATSVTLTFTKAEAVELTHRINMRQNDFTVGYKGGHEYNPLHADDIMPLYRKLNKVSGVFSV